MQSTELYMQLGSSAHSGLSGHVFGNPESGGFWVAVSGLEQETSVGDEWTSEDSKGTLEKNWAPNLTDVTPPRFSPQMSELNAVPGGLPRPDFHDVASSPSDLGSGSFYLHHQTHIVIRVPPKGREDPTAAIVAW